MVGLADSSAYCLGFCAVKTCNLELWAETDPFPFELGLVFITVGTEIWASGRLDKVLPLRYTSVFLKVVWVGVFLSQSQE